MPDPLRKLEVFVGRWELVMDHHSFKDTVHGVTSFAWYGGAFLEQQLVFDHPNFSNGVLLIGADEQTERYSVCYSDEQGTLRIYHMSVEDGVWRLWRDAPDSAQRFTGTFTPDQNMIDGVWEYNSDGRTWNHDFRLTYRKIV